MEYTTEFDEVNNICIVHVTGEHRRPRDSLVLQQLARDIGDTRGCQRFLFDMTQAHIISEDMDTYEVGTVPVDPDRRQQQQKVALLYSGDITEHKFLETIAVNRGYTLRVFDRMSEATEWLRPKDSG